MAFPFILMGAIIGIALTYSYYYLQTPTTPDSPIEDVVRDLRWALEYCSCPANEDKDDWREDYNDSIETYITLCKTHNIKIIKPQNPNK